jgi:hypothetical protein
MLAIDRHDAAVDDEVCTLIRKIFTNDVKVLREHNGLRGCNTGSDAQCDEPDDCFASWHSNEYPVDWWVRDTVATLPKTLVGGGACSVYFFESIESSSRLSRMESVLGRKRELGHMPLVVSEFLRVPAGGIGGRRIPSVSPARPRVHHSPFIRRPEAACLTSGSGSTPIRPNGALVDGCAGLHSPRYVAPYILYLSALQMNAINIPAICSSTACEDSLSRLAEPRRSASEPSAT